MSVITRLTKLILPIFVISSLLILGIGCQKGITEGTSRTSSGTDTDTDTDSDSDTDLSSTPGSKKTAHCSSLSSTPTRCQASVVCWFNKKNKKCEDISLDKKNSCSAIQIAKACEKSALSCRWDDNKSPAECISKLPDTTIHVWKKLSNPANIQAIYNKVVVSEDGKIYAFNTAVGAEGLWYKEKNMPWVQLNQLVAKPRLNATDIAPLDISGDDINKNLVKLYATHEGAVLQKDKQLVVLHGRTPVWALDSSIHNKDAIGADKTPEVENSAMSFSAVVNTVGGEAVFFQQDPEFKLVFHYVSHTNTEDLKTMRPKNAKGVDLKITLHAAANDSSGGLLLAGDTKEIKRKWQVFQIPHANNDLAKTPSGVASSEDPVLFSNPSITGTPWLNDAEPMTLVGEMGAYYFTNLISNAQTGLLSHKGPQKPSSFSNPSGSDPELSFAGKTVEALIKFEDTLYVATKDHGLLGANDKLEEDPVKNFDFQTFKDSKTEMMDDRKSAIDPDLNNQMLSNILQSNNNDEAYFVVKNLGIYTRTKLSGQPRL